MNQNTQSKHLNDQKKRKRSHISSSSSTSLPKSEIVDNDDINSILNQASIPNAVSCKKRKTNPLEQSISTYTTNGRIPKIPMYPSINNNDNKKAITSACKSSTLLANQRTDLASIFEDIENEEKIEEKATMDDKIHRLKDDVRKYKEKRNTVYKKSYIPKIKKKKKRTGKDDDNELEEASFSDDGDNNCSNSDENKDDIEEEEESDCGDDDDENKSRKKYYPKRSIDTKKKNNNNNKCTSTLDSINNVQNHTNKHCGDDTEHIDKSNTYDISTVDENKQTLLIDTSFNTIETPVRLSRKERRKIEEEEKKEQSTDLNTKIICYDDDDDDDNQSDDEDFVIPVDIPINDDQELKTMSHVNNDCPNDKVIIEDADDDGICENDVDCELDDLKLDEEGTFLHPMDPAVESLLAYCAKEGHSKHMRNKAVKDLLMCVSSKVYCNDITQDKSNPYYTDPNMCQKPYRPQTNKDRHLENCQSGWLESDFIRHFSQTKMMNALEKYDELEKTLDEDSERKCVKVFTEKTDLPLVDAKYIAEFLRPAITKFGERPCIAGDNCVSMHLYSYILNNTPTTVLSSSQSSINNNNNNNNNNQTKVIDSNGIPITQVKPTTWREGLNNNTTRGPCTMANKKGFVLREFLLPKVYKQYETDRELGVSHEDAIAKIEPSYCVLCTRFIITLKAIRCAAGLCKPPKNTIQNHRNHFGIIGEYEERRLLKPSESYCGIIAPIVEFSVSDYFVMSINNFHYKIRPGEDIKNYLDETGERGFVIKKYNRDTVVVEKLRRWVERNIVIEKNRFEEGINNSSSSSSTISRLSPQ